MKVYRVDSLGPLFSEMEIKNPYDETQPLSKQKQGILDIRAKDNETGAIPFSCKNIFFSPKALKGAFPKSRTFFS